MKIGIVTINYNRPRILDLWLASVDRLRKECGPMPVVVVSERTDADACADHGVHHIYQQNEPVSFKWNTGVQWLMEQGVDYVMIVGSDDIVSTDLMRNIQAATDYGYDVIGVDKLCFYGNIRGRSSVFIPLQSPRMLGVCRTISRSVLEPINGVICPKGVGSGMDALVTKTIAPHVRSTKIVDGMVVDVKSRRNINKLSYWAAKIKDRLPLSAFYDILSKEEKILLDRVNNAVS
jgi:glycosyltransferase involved in cell wall biosynthesis